MEQLDDVARSVGQSACGFLFRGEHDTVSAILCSDGTYSAGWKLLVAFFVIIGIVLAWVGVNRGGQKL